MLWVIWFLVVPYDVCISVMYLSVAGACNNRAEKAGIIVRFSEQGSRLFFIQFWADSEGELAEPFGQNSNLF